MSHLRTLLVLPILAAPALAQCLQGEPVGPASTAIAFEVHTLAVWDRGPSLGRVLAAGLLDFVTPIAPSVALFDGVQWTHPTTSGFTLYSVESLAGFDAGSGSELYAGCGVYDSLNQFHSRVVRWNGTQWSNAGGDNDGIVHALVAFDDGSGSALYAGGQFSNIGGVPMAHVARWNGTAWSPVGAGHAGIVYDLAAFDDGSGTKLYAAGGGAEPVVLWDGVSWSPVGAPVGGGAVFALEVFDDGTGPALYAAGALTSPGNSIARWNGTSWSAVGGGMDGWVRDLAVVDDGTGGGPALYATGEFTHADGLPANRVARWDGVQWSAVGSGVNASGFALAEFEESLVVGGSFTQAFGAAIPFLARWRSCGPLSSFCAGDGVDAHVTTACPCGNVGGVGRGCAWHAGPMGALLAASGTTNPDALVLTASGMPASAPSTIFLKGDVLIPGGVVFGDGVRCVGGNLIRLGTKTNVGGAAQYPEAGNVAISVRGQTPVGSGAIGYYQTYYRNAAVFCTSSTFNVTNAVRVVW
ncbi:MAG: hypothetical protein U1F29_10625 [Planctomycetota bacterium]